MQGVRDYIKFIKRGFGRTSHLTSIDVRNKRMTRDKALELTKLYDGKRPKALDIFLKILNISEDDFYSIIEKQIVAPNEMKNINFLKKNTSNVFPDDYEDWEKKFNFK